MTTTLTLLGIIIAAIIAFAVFGRNRQKGVPNPPHQEPAAPPVVPPAPPTVPPPPPPPIERPVDPVSPPVPPVAVVPPPPAPPDPPPAPRRIDYSDWHGETRGSIEQAMRAGLTLPMGWSWADAFASGHVRDVAEVPMGGPAPNTEDRRNGVLEFREGSVIEEFEGQADSIFVVSIPVPAGWRGRIQIGCYGQRGQSQYGGAIDSLDFTVVDAQGKVWMNVQNASMGGAIDTIAVTDKPFGTGDIGPLTCTVHLDMGGTGYMQMNVYPR